MSSTWVFLKRLYHLSATSTEKKKALEWVLHQRLATLKKKNATDTVNKQKKIWHH